MSSETQETAGRGIGSWLPYALAGVMAVVLVVITISRGGPSDAAKDTLGGKQLKIMAPADPGGGWDSTARAMQAALEPIVGRSEVYNVTGAGGTIGLSQFVNYEGQSNQLMVTGLVMVGAIAANEPKDTLEEVTPIAELVNEEQLIAVPKDSPIKDVGDLEAAMKKDIKKVAWAGGSAGGAEQILAGRIAQELKLDPADVNYIAHSGGGEAIATLLSRKDTVGVSSVSEFRPQIEAGKLRPIAVASGRAGGAAEGDPDAEGERHSRRGDQLARRGRASRHHQGSAPRTREHHRADDEDQVVGGHPQA